jgi:hypothetical protein
MTLASLLVFAVAFEADAGTPWPAAVATDVPVRAASQQEQPFKTAPLQLARPSLVQRPLFSLDERDANLGGRHRSVVKQQEPTVVCAIRVIRVDPRVDSGLVRKSPARELDPIVRDDLSACAP